jgi:hypothetical protein
MEFQERFATEGSGRVRLQVLKDASGVSLCGFVKDTTAAGAIVHGARTTYRQITNTPRPETINVAKPWSPRGVWSLDRREREFSLSPGPGTADLWR